MSSATLSCLIPELALPAAGPIPQSGHWRMCGIEFAIYSSQACHSVILTCALLSQFAGWPNIVLQMTRRTSVLENFTMQARGHHRGGKALTLFWSSSQVFVDSDHEPVPFLLFFWIAVRLSSLMLKAFIDS